MPPSPSGSNESAMADRVCRTVRETIDQGALIAPKSTVLVGVSGGGDSVALLFLLHELLTPAGIALAVAHLDHGLRPRDSDKEAAFVSALANRLALPCHIRRADVAADAKSLGLNVEDAGRQSRYRFFEDLRRIAGYHCTALGHHGDDNAELVLLNLMRGSGPQGLAGMAPKRSDGIIRPLIRLRRSDLATYLKVKGIDHLTDPSNQDLHYRRNRIRHELLPHLADTYNPNIVPGLNRLAGILQDESEWLTALVAPLFQKAVIDQGPESVRLDVPLLHRNHVAARRRVIRMAIEQVKGDLKRMGHTHIQSVIDLMASRKSRGSLDLPDRIRVRRENDSMTLTKMPVALRQAPPLPVLSQGSAEFCRLVPLLSPADPAPFEMALSPRDGWIVFSFPSIGKTLEIHKAGQAIAFFDMTSLSFPLMVRNWRPGDRFVPLGMTESVGVDRFLAKQRVDKQQILRTLVLESRGKVVWVIGHRIDDAVKIRPNTSQILKAEFGLA